MGDEFEPFEDDAVAWEENEVAHDRELDEEFDGSTDEEPWDEYGDDESSCDNDIDFGIDG